MGGPAVSGEVALLSAAIVQLVYEFGLSRSQSAQALSFALEAVMAPPLREKLGAEDHRSVGMMLDRRVDAGLPASGVPLGTGGAGALGGPADGPANARTHSEP